MNLLLIGDEVRSEHLLEIIQREVYGINSQVGRVHFCVSGVLLAASAEANSTQVRVINAQATIQKLKV